MKDAFAKGRIRRSGVDSPRAVLTPTDVLEIRAKRAGGHTPGEYIAAEYGVTTTSIRLIEQRKTWASIPG